jgi:hypothetical protein
MIMRSLFKVLSAAAFAGLIITSCKKENAEEENNDNELITTVLVSVREKDAVETQEFSWRDIDGAGGADPVIETISLLPGKIYEVQLGVLDESQGTAVGITDEIAEESDVHRFYFTSSPGLGITAANLDKDDNNLPAGLNSTWTTKAAGTGTMAITLRHYPNGGKEETDPVNSSKSTTDAEVIFPVEVKAP